VYYTSRCTDIWLPDEAMVAASAGRLRLHIERGWRFVVCVCTWVIVCMCVCMCVFVCVCVRVCVSVCVSESILAGTARSSHTQGTFVYTYMYKYLNLNM